MKKAQLQIMQNMFVLLFVFFILAAALMFYMWFRNQDMQQTMYDFRDLEHANRANIINMLPELRCSEQTVNRVDCIDLEKLEYFKDSLLDHEYYYVGLFGNIQIKLQKYNETYDYWQEHLIYNNSIQNPQIVKKIEVPVILLEPSVDQTSFGRLLVHAYS